MIQTEFPFVQNERPWNRFRARQRGDIFDVALKKQFFGIPIDDIVHTNPFIPPGIIGIVGSGIVLGTKVKMSKVHEVTETPLMFSGVDLQSKYPGTWKMTELKIETEEVDVESEKMESTVKIEPIQWAKPTFSLEFEKEVSTVDKVKKAAMDVIEKVTTSLMSTFSMASINKETCSCCGEKAGQCPHTGVKK